MKKLLPGVAVGVLVAVLAPVVVWQLSSDDELRREGALAAGEPVFKSPNGEYSLVIGDTGVVINGPTGSITLDKAGAVLQSGGAAVKVTSSEGAEVQSGATALKVKGDEAVVESGETAVKVNSKEGANVQSGGNAVKVTSSEGAKLLSGETVKSIEGAPGPTGPQGPAGQQGAQGPSGATNVLRRIGPETSIAANGTATAEVYCQSGERAVGGGGATNNVAAYMTHSAPWTPGGAAPSTPTAWRVTYHTNSAQGHSIWAWVVCVAP